MNSELSKYLGVLLGFLENWIWRDTTVEMGARQFDIKIVSRIHNKVWCSIDLRDIFQKTVFLSVLKVKKLLNKLIWFQTSEFRAIQPVFLFTKSKRGGASALACSE